MKKEMVYLKKGNNTEKVIRTELLLTPILIFMPLFIGLLFIYDWYDRGFVEGASGYFGTLLIGIIILVSNFLFDIPFIKSLMEITRSKNKK
ncbi:MAG: hypothetical protein JSV67_05005 [Thermoplasmatales archaeon]|nr:MAG: hypothetical protein JSV67_05005 [Thermoplasmatales archaeon]